MYILLAKVVGKKSFTSKDNKKYNVVNVIYKSQYCEGFEVGQVFVDDIDKYTIDDKIEVSVQKGKVYLVQRGDMDE